MNALEHFIENEYQHIAELIEKQQIDYGLHRIHGQAHISRCIIIAENLLNLLISENDDNKKLQVYYAICFHDIGRKGECEDIWQQESYDYCVNYLSNKYDKEFVNDTANLMLKKNELNESVYSKIVYDSDCYDIMRSGTGRGGIYGFDKRHLKCFNDNDQIQDKLVQFAWKLINLTDNNEYENIYSLKNMYQTTSKEWQLTL